MHRSPIDPNLVPAGALVAFIQKGMQYMELEANVEVGAGFFGTGGRRFWRAPPAAAGRGLWNEAHAHEHRPHAGPGPP